MPDTTPTLRDRIAEALIGWAYQSNDRKYAALRRDETVRANAYSRADAVLAVLPTAPLAEVWQVWREDEAPYAHFASVDDARQGTVDFWEEDEPSCPDYSWDRQAAGKRLELLVGGVHSGVYASRHPVYGGPASAPAAPADQATDRRDRYAAAIRDNDGWVLDGGQHMLDAVMAVADTEQAVLAATLREVLDTFGPMHDVYGGPVSYYDGSADITPAQYEGWRAVLDAVPRRLADEAQPTAQCPGFEKEYQGISDAKRRLANCRYCGQPRATHAATTATEAARCTCADAGPEFAPAGHYADCPHAATAATEEPQP